NSAPAPTPSTGFNLFELLSEKWPIGETRHRPLREHPDHMRSPRDRCHKQSHWAEVWGTHWGSMKTSLLGDDAEAVRRRIKFDWKEEGAVFRWWWTLDN